MSEVTDQLAAYPGGRRRPPHPRIAALLSGAARLPRDAWPATAAEAREKMRGIDFDLIVLDVMMPGETGNRTCARRCARRTRGVPILMLSALADPPTASGLDVGRRRLSRQAVRSQELLLRIRSVLRRASPRAGQPEEVRFGDCSFNPGARRIAPRRRTGAADHARTRPAAASGRSGRASRCSRAELAQPGAEESLRSVDVQINRLRQKIETDPANPVYLQTVRGAGYTLHVD